MKILVCIGNVPDTTTKIAFDAAGKELNRNGVTFVIGPYEEYSLSWAVGLQEKDPSVKITVLCVGLADTEPVIRKALAVGANDAVRINANPEDAYFTAVQIAEYAKGKEFDLVMFGKESIDFNGSQIPAMVAELLDLPFVSFCTELNVTGGQAKLKREVTGGVEVLECPLPLAVSAQKGMAEWRIPNMRGIMAARTKPLTVIEPVNAEVMTQVSRLELPPAKAGCHYIKPENVNELVQVLNQKGVL
jgi:electron transfer flavoprotein beta subunit